MEKEPNRLSDKAQSDLRVLASLKDDQRQKVIDLVIDKNDYESIQNGMFRYVLIEHGFSANQATAVTSVIQNISTIFSSTESKLRFTQDVEHSFLDKEHVKLKQFFTSLEEKGILDKVADAATAINLTYFGIPHIYSVRLVTDYRIFTTRRGNKEIIPVIIAKIMLHREHDDESSSMETVMCQFDLPYLDDLINTLESFRETVIKEKASLHIGQE